MAGTADSVVQFGLSQIGRKFKTGAQFVYTAYAVCGVDIPKHGMSQLYRAGMSVPGGKAGLAEGDLVFPTSPGRIVGLYIGGNYWLAVSKAGYVTRSPVRRVWRAVRVVTPGGIQGLQLARPGYTRSGEVPGRRPKGLAQ